MFRKNDETSNRFISVKENGNTVTDAIIYNSSDKQTTAFYLQGIFNPDKIKSLSNPETFSKFSQDIINNYKSQMAPDFNPNYN